MDSIYLAANSFLSQKSPATMVTPYEPPPDYPMVESEWREQKPRTDRREIKELSDKYRNPYAVGYPYGTQNEQRLYRVDPYYQHGSPMMMRTRQYPEVAGYGGDQPLLRRFTRYPENMQQQNKEQPTTAFSKSSKKPSFFTGNWTFRDKKVTRPALPNTDIRRDDRPMSMIVTDGCRMFSGRSRSEVPQRQLQTGEWRVPVRFEKSTVPPEAAIRNRNDYTTCISVEPQPLPMLRPRREDNNNNNQDNFKYNQSRQLRKSCPDLDTVLVCNFDEHRISKKRNRRAKEKIREAKWRSTRIEDWCLDDVLIWLQHLQLDEVASLLIGYDIRGEDLLKWDHQCLGQLGVVDPCNRSKILTELKLLRENGPLKEEKRQTQKTLFDLVRNTSYDQVLAVETPLTPRDITVSHGRMGCLQITKVNGGNLPLKEGDCLLEVNERPGEQFKSALMLTKLITSSNGQPIRFVVLRRKVTEETQENSIETSSSGISSAPRSPSD